MRHLQVLLLLLCVLVGWVATAQQHGNQKLGDRQRTAQEDNVDEGPTQRQVRQASERLRQAVMKRDADAMRQILAMNYSGVDPLGRPLDRTRAVNVVANELTTVDRMDVDTESIRAGRDNAVQAGSAYIAGSLAGKTFNTGYRFIRQWQRDGGQWKLVSTRILGAGGGF